MMDGPRCLFCQRQVPAQTTRCPFCGQPAIPQPRSAGLYVPAIPHGARVQLQPVGMIGALLIFCGTLLPWFSISLVFLGTRQVETILGWQTGGLLTLPLALLIGLFSTLTSPSRRWLLLGCSAATLLLGLYKLVEVHSVQQSFRGNVALGMAVEAAPGLGLYMVLAGALLSLVGALRERMS